MNSENYEKIFSEHYKDALHLISNNTYQATVLNRLLENHLLKKNWITLSKHEKKFSQDKSILYNENIASIKLQLKDVCTDEDTRTPNMIHSTFPSNTGIQLLLKCSLYAYDKAIYHFHHSTIQPSSPVKGLSELQETVKYAKRIEDLLSDPSVKQLCKSLPFRALSNKPSLINFNEKQAYEFDELRSFFSTYAQRTDEIIKIFQQAVGQLPIPIPLSSSKKNYSARGRDYFIKILYPTMIDLFDKPNDRIIAEITNAIFEIYSTDENTVTKIRLSAQ